MEDLQTQIPVELGGFSATPPNPLENLWKTTISQAAGSMAAPVDDPFVRLKRHISEARKRWQDRQRAADDAALPLVIDDYKASVQRADAVQQRINLAMESLNAPPPAFQQPQLNQGEQLTAGIAALLAPEGMNQVLSALQASSQARTQTEMDNALRAYGLDRETAKMGLQQLLGQLDREEGIQDRAKGQEFALRRDAQNQEFSMQQSFDDAEMGIAELEFKDFLNRQGEEREHARGLETARVKAEAEGWASRQKSLDDAINDLRGEIQGTLNSLGEITDEDRKVYEARRKALKDAGVPEAKLPHIPKGKTRLQVQYEEGKPKAEQDFNNAVLRGKILDKQLNKPDPPSAEQKAAGKSFGAAQTAVDKAIRATNTAFANLPPEPTGFLNSALDLKYRTAMSAFEAAVQKEYDAVMQKRQVANPNAPIPSFENYLQSALNRYKPKGSPTQTQMAPAAKVKGDKTSSIYMATRTEALGLIKKHPDKAAAIRKRFRDTFGVDLK